MQLASPGGSQILDPPLVLNINVTVNLFCWCSNWPTFPQIFIKGEFVGGSDIILSLHQASF
jgi:glutaredoxin-related protein